MQRQKRTARLPEMDATALGAVAEVFLGVQVIPEFPLSKLRHVLKEDPGRFRVDYYCPVLACVIEYDGHNHYNEVDKVERDARKNGLLQRAGITVKRWPYYLQLTRDAARWFWGRHYSDDKFQRAIQLVYKTADEAQVLAPGLHGSVNTPANFCERGRRRFLAELNEVPESVRSQVVHSFQLYLKRKQDEDGVDTRWLLLPETSQGFDERFEKLMQHKPRVEHLNCLFPNAPWGSDSGKVARRGK